MIKQPLSYTALLKNIWDCIYNPNLDTTETIQKFFHENYEQCINGIYMHRKEYIAHVIAQKNNLIIEAIDYKKILEKNNELFAIYYPKGKNSNNALIKAEVIAYFIFENQQIIKIHGQVRFISGESKDADMK